MRIRSGSALIRVIAFRCSSQCTLRLRFALLLLLPLLLASEASLFAQVGTATLSGTVTDPSGAVVVNAEVQAVNTGTNFAQITHSNSTGLYVFDSLPPGHYRLTGKSPGFKEVLEQGLILHVQDTVTVNLKMELGSPSESVTVKADALLINTQDATVGTVVERQIVENMPLNGRSFQGLIALSPGVATIAAGNASTGQFVVNGQRSDTNYFTVDGVSANAGAPPSGSLSSNGTGTTPINSATGGYNNMVSIDALQEFRISTSSFAPEFGRSPGGQISLISRGGTNSFHGDVFDYFRNTVLDANDWFVNAAGKPRSVVQQNDFGGVVGGPIIRNKLFFFVSYEGLRLDAPSPAVKQVPTQAARTLAAAAKANGVVGYMAQFANAYPLPDGNASTPCTSFATCTANYTASFPNISALDSTSGRIDYNLSKSFTLFGRYSHSPSSLTVDNSATATTFVEGNDVYTAGLTWAISNSMNNDLRFNFTHTTALQAVNPIRFAGSLSTIFPSGFAQPPSTFLSDPATIAVQIRGLPTDGLLIEPAADNNGNDQQNITDSFGWVKGSHSLKFGVDFRQLDPAYDQSNFNLNSTFAQTTTALAGFPSVQNVCPASSLPAGSGAAVPGYICGQASLSNLQHNFIQHFRYRQFSSFAQDTWKVNTRLTLTYGVRWEINPPFQWTSNNPGFSVQRSTFNRSNLSQININPFGTPAYATTWGNFSPRVGVAYQLSKDPKWGRVLRAGYGMFYDTGAQVGSSLSNPFNARFNNIGSGATAPTVQYPVATSNTFYLTPPAARTNLPVSNGGTDNLIDPNFTLPYVHEVNVTLEQQLGGNQTLTASYVGAFGRRLIGDLLYPANDGNPAVFAQVNPTTGVATPDALVIIGNYSSSSYDSFQTKFQRQFSSGLAAIASYTWAHSIDDASVNSQVATQTLPTSSQLGSGLPLALLRGDSDFDVRQNLALSMVYDFPNPSNAFARAILGHWSFDPIYHYQTAMPLDILTGVTSAIGGTGYQQRPNLMQGVPMYVYGADCAALNKGQACPGGEALNTAPVSAAAVAAAGCAAPTSTNAKGAFCTPLLVKGQAVSGDVGRNALRGFPLQELDFSIHRDFPIHEQIRLRFQADMFNVFNHPVFGPENVTLNSPQFGTTTAMANSSLGANAINGSGFNAIFNTGGPRNFQLALKLSF